MNQQHRTKTVRGAAVALTAVLTVGTAGQSAFAAQMISEPPAVTGSVSDNALTPTTVVTVIPEAKKTETTPAAVDHTAADSAVTVLEPSVIPKETQETVQETAEKPELLVQKQEEWEAAAEVVSPIPTEAISTVEVTEVTDTAEPIGEEPSPTEALTTAEPEEQDAKASSFEAEAVPENGEAPAEEAESFETEVETEEASFEQPEIPEETGATVTPSGERTEVETSLTQTELLPAPAAGAQEATSEEVVSAGIVELVGDSIENVGASSGANQLIGDTTKVYATATPTPNTAVKDGESTSSQTGGMRPFGNHQSTATPTVSPSPTSNRGRQTSRSASQPTAKPAAKTSTPKTGDTPELLFYASMLTMSLLAAAGAAASLLIRRKKAPNE